MPGCRPLKLKLLSGLRCARCTAMRYLASLRVPPSSSFVVWVVLSFSRETAKIPSTSEGASVRRPRMPPGASVMV